MSFHPSRLLVTALLLPLLFSFVQGKVVKGHLVTHEVRNFFNEMVQLGDLSVPMDDVNFASVLIRRNGHLLTDSVSCPSKGHFSMKSSTIK